MLPPTLRRGHPRYSINNITSYRHEDKSVLTLTLDVGLGGMKIKTHGRLPEGEELIFHLLLCENSIWPKGRIAYSRFLPDQQVVSGIEFTELSAEDHTLLRDYLAQLAKWPRRQPMGSTRRSRDNWKARSKIP